MVGGFGIVRSTSYPKKWEEEKRSEGGKEGGSGDGNEESVLTKGLKGNEIGGIEGSEENGSDKQGDRPLEPLSFSSPNHSPQMPSLLFPPSHQMENPSPPPFPYCNLFVFHHPTK